MLRSLIRGQPSGVKAIPIAARQGQKIYTITQKNAALALPKLSLSRGVAEEIQNAIASGKEVTVHEKAINAYGFSGFGYAFLGFITIAILMIHLC